ncbi:hypothetical protein F6X40_11280 [Paraburkholderia sp. UCT31]|uniref:hypothetical protein n=1 Tax=Paraburkholderia sp. UCT31 TaxID=2615209 RepID=UPI001655991F|nr:hypothetical protein [Paraburkholderia sp. UCT31]MBC8737386.1 hypothetical protein [Paraburkholderia sp. UCT31]
MLSQDKDFEQVVAAAEKAGNRTYTLTVTNHQLGPSRFETRFAFRDEEGCLLAAAAIARSSALMELGFEEEVCSIVQNAAGRLPSSMVRVDRRTRPHEETEPYPLDADDPPTWQTRLPGA